MIFQIALRNLTRDKRRTIITSLMLIISATLVSFTLGMSDGSYSTVINLFTRNYTGHFKIETKKYVDENLLYYTIKNTKDIEDLLLRNNDIESFTKRSFSGGLVFAKEKTFGASLVGVDWKLEQSVTRIQNRFKEKASFNKGEYQVAIGFKLAKYFDLKIGDEVVIIGSGADGSIANDIFIVKTIFNESSGERDDYAVYMDLDSFNEFHTLSGVHEFSVISKNINNKNIAKNLTLPSDLIARSWQEVEEEFYLSMVKDKEGTNISLLIIMLVVGLGVMNTVLMSILERTKEFGLMKALGTTPFDISKIILLESFFLASISIVIGVSLGYLVNLYFSTNGIQLGEPISYGGMVMDTMSTENNGNTVFVPIVLLYFTTFIATIYPIIKANQVSPIESMRGH
jgi:ABC-type lipoprotein release transport system permease subunit